MNALEIINKGLQASIQDFGRFGYGDFGICESGVMDEEAYKIANALVANTQEPVIEIALGGLVLKSHGKHYIALSGAIAKAYINEQEISFYKTYELKNNDILKIGFSQIGQRVYLSVKGGFDIEPTYGSYSTTIKEELGGFKSRALENGDLLPTFKYNFNEIRKLKKEHYPEDDEILILRLVKSYQWDKFAKEQRDNFFSSIYTVTQQNDRMGYRLSGQKILCDISDIISEPIAYGAVQIPSHGEPIVLLKERQSIGGYPKIGSVIPIDCFKLAQKKQGSKVKFQEINIKEAREICLARSKDAI